MAARDEHARAVLLGLKTTLSDNLKTEITTINTAAGTDVPVQPIAFEIGDLDGMDDATDLIHVGIGLLSDIDEDRSMWVQYDTVLPIGIHVRSQTGFTREEGYLNALTYARAVENVVTEFALDIGTVFGAEIDSVSRPVAVDENRNRYLVELAGRLIARTARIRSASQ